MKAHAQQLIADAARALAGKARTAEEMHDALFLLVQDIVSPGRASAPDTTRRAPLANEVLPRHQRSSWAREKTEHDV